MLNLFASTSPLARWLLTVLLLSESWISGPSRLQVLAYSSRTMQYVIDSGSNLPIWDPKTEQQYLRGHGWFQINGDQNKGIGAIRIEIAVDENKNMFVRIMEFDSSLAGQEIGQKAGRFISPEFDLTSLELEDFIDLGTGDGIVARAWGTDKTWDPTKRTCHNLFLDILAEAERTQDIAYEAPDNVLQRITSSNSAASMSTDPNDKARVVDRIGYVKANADGTKSSPKWFTIGKDGTDMSVGIKAPETTPDITGVATAEDAILQFPDEQLPANNWQLGDQKDIIKPPANPVNTGDGKGNIKGSLARVGGTLKSFSTLPKAAFSVIGIAGDLIGAVFAILDFVNHNWVGGALGSVGTGMGIALGIIGDEPLAWIVGGVIAVLFAILPKLFKDAKTPGKIADVQEIVQWSFFGDSTITGNEQCQKGTSDIPGNPNCQALYGSGVIALAFGLNNFESVALLIQINDGYPITIPELAKALYVINPQKEGDGSNQIATINCNNQPLLPGGKAGLIGDNPSLCNHPSYSVNLDLITLPVINEKASAIQSRIIPAPGGDCEIVTYPGDTYYAQYNLTWSGVPCAIACGLTSAVNISGVALPVDSGYNSSDPNLVSNGNQSTDGQGGHFIPPPPQKPFQQLTPAKYPCLSSGGKNQFCLTNGTYGPPASDNLKVDTLTLPPGGGWSMTTTYHTQAEIHTPSRTVDNKYTTNQKPSGVMNDLEEDWINLYQNVDGSASWSILGPNDGPDPVVCFFTATSYSGDIACLGLGGGTLPAGFVNNTKSIALYNKAQAQLFPVEYGFDGALSVTTSEKDLSAFQYGAQKETYSDNAVAVYIFT